MEEQIKHGTDWWSNIGFVIPNKSITLTGDSIFYSPKVTRGEMKTITIPQSDTPCKPEHKVDGVIPMLYDLHFDGRTCDCQKLIFRSEECGCGIKEYRLHKYPNE